MNSTLLTAQSLRAVWSAETKGEETEKTANTEEALPGRPKKAEDITKAPLSQSLMLLATAFPSCHPPDAGGEG